MNYVDLNKNNRYAELNLPLVTGKIKIKVSREKCNDVLVEVVDEAGNALSKPLHKIIPELKPKKAVAKMRFIMNNFSTSPIEIKLSF